MAEVVRGKVSQEISETGQIKKGEKVNLGFKNAGRIDGVYVNVGDRVAAWQILAELDTAELQIQLQEAKSNLAAYQAKLDKLLAGASQEEINVARAEAENKKVALAGAKQDLQDSYDDALSALDDAYLKAYNSQNVADSLSRTYFTSTDQESLNVNENKNRIGTAVSQIKPYIDGAKLNPIYENIDSALSQTKNRLSDIVDCLRIIRENCETALYRSTVSTTDKSTIDTHRANINTALAGIINSQQAISSARLDVSSAESLLQKAENELSSLLTPARQEDKDLYEAQTNQARAQVQLLENKIKDANLYSLISGQITEIKKRAGEMVQPTLQDAVIVLLPDVPFEIEADIYEEDVMKISAGNVVDISLIAIPDKVFGGKVISIYPAEEQIEGVVYYKVIIAFDELPEAIKPGMTADIVIKTASKENVLLLPEAAVEKRDGKEFVLVYKDKQKEEREIKTGLLGSDGNVEVLSGLEVGEKVIMP